MKKTQMLSIYNLILFALMLISLSICYFLFESFFYKTWYAIIILFYSIRLFVKYFLFGSDSVLWFALVLFGIFAFIIAFNVFGLSIKQWPILAQIPSMASGIVYMIYKNYLHLYLNILINTTTTPLFLLSMKLTNIWVFLIVEILAIVAAIITVNVIEHKFKKR